MRVVTISLSQLVQLRTVRKSFIVLVCGSWQTKYQNQWVKSLELKVGSSSYVLFRLIVNINSESEEYCIDTLNILSLPSLALFSEGQLYNVIDISNGTTNVDLSECRNADYLLEELVKFQPHNASIINFITDVAHLGGTGIGNLFLSGDRSSVGKSSMCLAILVSLLKKGVPPSTLAYIKPVTQCEAEQPVTKFCERVGIRQRGIGPVVFYKGFTRAYLAGETGPAEALLEEAKSAVEEVAQDKLFTLVDGVGYPAVGSICNLSNADVAKKLDAPVLLVGKSGVGDAVDSYNLNSAFFALKGVRVLGGVFNKLPLDGYYSLDSCKEAVTSYFEQYKPTEMPYGFVPVIDAKPTEKKCSIVGTATASIETPPISEPSADMQMDVSAGDTIAEGAANIENSYTTIAQPVIEYTEFEEALSEALLAHVDLDRLMHDLWLHELLKRVEESPSSRSPSAAVRRASQLETQLASAAFLGSMGNMSGGDTGDYRNSNTGHGSYNSSDSNSSNGINNKHFGYGYGGGATFASGLIGSASNSSWPGNKYNGSSEYIHNTGSGFAPSLLRMSMSVPVSVSAPVQTKSVAQKRSREEVEQEARKQGAVTS